MPKMSEMKKKPMTAEAAMSRLADLCSRTEVCVQTCREKLAKWDVPAADAEQVVSRLLSEKYVDEERFARFYAKDKHRFSKWGKKKIEMQLKAKGIDKQFIDSALEEIDDCDYEEQLKDLVLKKLKSTKAKNAYDMKGKLVRFALGKGFEGELSFKVIDRLLRDFYENDEYDESSDF